MLFGSALSSGILCWLATIDASFCPVHKGLVVLIASLLAAISYTRGDRAANFAFEVPHSSDKRSRACPIPCGMRRRTGL